jgi:hypothetical protein
MTHTLRSPTRVREPCERPSSRAGNQRAPLQSLVTQIARIHSRTMIIMHNYNFKISGGLPGSVRFGSVWFGFSTAVNQTEPNRYCGLNREPNRSKTAVRFGLRFETEPCRALTQILKMHFDTMSTCHGWGDESIDVTDIFNIIVTGISTIQTTFLNGRIFVYICSLFTLRFSKALHQQSAESPQYLEPQASILAFKKC